MSARVIKEEQNSLIEAHMLETGQYGRVVDGPHKDKIVAKVYPGDRVVDIGDPRNTWPNNRTGPNCVEVLPPGTKIGVTVDG